jgi:pimeloyl-ACP methyl ester carboxylesterase
MANVSTIDEALLVAALFSIFLSVGVFSILPTGTMWAIYTWLLPTSLLFCVSARWYYDDSEESTQRKHAWPGFSQILWLFHFVQNYFPQRVHITKGFPSSFIRLRFCTHVGQEMMKPPTKEAQASAWEKRKAELVVSSLTLVDGRSISYHIDGDRSRPAVLLLHGMMHSRMMWIAENVPEECYYVVPDRPGYFDSSDPPCGYCYAEFAKDINQLMHHLQISKFAIIGHSSGGPYALAVAAILGPAKVTTVALVGSDTEYRNPSPKVPVDPLSKDVLASFAERYQGAWVRATSVLSAERGKSFFLIFKHLIRLGFMISTKDLLRGDEVTRLWNKCDGKNFFRWSLQESATTGTSNMAGMAHDFAIERHQRWDFDVNMVGSRVLVFAGALDDLARDACHFNHEVLLPGSEMYVIPACGHLGIVAESVMSEIVGTVLMGWQNPGAFHVPTFCCSDKSDITSSASKGPTTRADD